MKADGIDVIGFGCGEPDFDTPWHVRDEGIFSLEKGKTFYTANSGLKELRKEISNYIQRTQNIEYDPDKEIMVTVGGSEAIDIGLRAIVNDEDEVIIPQPSYVSYEPCTILANAKPVIINLKSENNFNQPIIQNLFLKKCLELGKNVLSVSLILLIGEFVFITFLLGICQNQRYYLLNGTTRLIYIF